MAHATRVVVIAPQDLIRNGLVALLNRRPNTFAVVGNYRNLETAESKLSNGEIDVLLLDDSVPLSVSILERVAQLHRRFPSLAILILGWRLNRRYVQLLFGAGAVGYVYRDDCLEETLLPGIETVMQGYFYTSPRASGLMVNSHAAAPTLKLNGTDLEVLDLIGAGLAVKDIARMLQLKLRTIYRIRNKLRLALGAPTNEHIVAAALERGLINANGRITPKPKP